MTFPAFSTPEEQRSRALVSLDNTTAIFTFALCTSLLLSFWGAYSETVINPDGICYLLSAQSVGDRSWQQLLHLCPQSGWPFYAVLIHYFAKISTLSYSAAAYTIDGVFTCLSVTAFLLISKEMGAGKKLLWIAAVVILLHHDFNSLRQSIIRDHGYWACYLWSIWLLYRYVQKPVLSTALLWSLTLVIGTLFRREGIFFLIAIPFLVSFLRTPFKLRLRYFLQLNTLSLVAGAVVFVWAVTHRQTSIAILQTAYEQAVNLFVLTKTRFHNLHVFMKDNVIKSASQNDVTIVLLLVYFSWYLINIVSALNWAYAIMAVIGMRVMQLSRDWRFLLLAYIVINLVITLVFQVEHQFISRRYLMALCLTLMLFIPYSVAILEKHRIIFAGLLLGVLISALGGIVGFGVPKTFIHDAGDWIAANIPAHANLYSNDYQLMYYSQHFGRDIFAKIHEYHRIETIENGKWKNFDYLALRLSHSDPDKVNKVVQQLSIKPMTIFQNKRGDNVAIYKVPGEAR